MAIRIARREFIAGVAAAWPLAARAQRGDQVRRVGAISSYSEKDSLGQASAAAFKRRLEHLGWFEGKNIKVDYRFASGDPALYKTYATELVGMSPDAILAGTSPAVAALQPMTRTIPIVFVLVVDPVGQGFVQSLARPGGNITGFSSYDAPILGKWLDFLKEIDPNLKRVTVIFNPDTAPFAKLFNRSCVDGPGIARVISSVLAIGRVRSCVRPVDAAHAAGPDEVRGSGPNQYFRA